MIWKLEFKNEEAKNWFEFKFKPIKLIHDHFDEEEGYTKGVDFLYDAGYNGYAEAESFIKELKENGITYFGQLCLCDTEDFKEVLEA